MTERLLIDGVDVYADYGVYVVKDGWDGLVGWAPLKAPTTYTFPECDGVEADLTDPKLDTRDCSIKFAFSGETSRYKGFIRMLSDGAYHIFNCASIGREYRLRLVSQSSLSLYPLLGFFELKFADDFPLRGYTYTAPSVTDNSGRGLTIDGVPISAYGAILNSDTASNILAMPNVRSNLLVKSCDIAGCYYDGDAVTFEGMDVKIPLLFRADTFAGLWNNYDTLLYSLTRPDERVIKYASDLGQILVRGYYKSMTVKGFYPNDRKWLEAEITIAVTNARVPAILIAENGNAILTEAGDKILVFE